jgi:hypothetical protein
MYSVKAKNSIGKGEKYFLRFPLRISTIIAPGRENKFLRVNQTPPSRPKMAVVKFCNMNFIVNRPVLALCPHSGQKFPSNSVSQFKHFILPSSF